MSGRDPIVHSSGPVRSAERARTTLGEGARTVALALLLAAPSATLSACGQSGPLYLPPPGGAAQPEAVAPSGDDGDEETDEDDEAS